MKTAFSPRRITLLAAGVRAQQPVQPPPIDTARPAALAFEGATVIDVATGRRFGVSCRGGDISIPPATEATALAILRTITVQQFTTPGTYDFRDPQSGATERIIVTTGDENESESDRRRVAGDSTGGRATAAVTHDALGVAGLLAVARAFVEAGMRPRRSVLFVATSGADQEFAGAEFVASAVVPQSARAPSRAVASLTLDLIGGYSDDSVAVDGLEEIDAGLPAAWLTASHADSGLTIVSGSIVRAPCADQYAFVRRKVPSLYFHDPSSRHDRMPPRPSALAVPDPAPTARVARLAFDFARAIANADRSARWSADALERLDESRVGE